MYISSLPYHLHGMYVTGLLKQPSYSPVKKFPTFMEHKFIIVFTKAHQRRHHNPADRFTEVLTTFTATILED
jgi:hypothetical protein